VITAVSPLRSEIAIVPAPWCGMALPSSLRTSISPSMPCWSAQGSPASLWILIHSVRPSRREASTTNAPCVRSFSTEASAQVEETAGKTLATPP
jgi:hypothetical protein